jgi:isopenicillin-N N-acyltransferase-like protein
MNTTPFPLIEVSGAPFDRGVQYGRQAAARIHKGASHYLEQLKAMSLSPGDISRLVEDFVPYIDAFDPNYVVEMRGIAEGANIEFEAVALLNARTEILKLGKRKADEKKAAEDPDGCTGAVLLPEATREGVVIHGQNWDWKAECAETSVVLKVRRDDGPDYMTFTEAGGLARAGMNANGIAITANYLESDRDYRDIGVPLALIRRKVLEQEHYPLALRVVNGTKKSAANNMIVSYAEGFAIDFECAPDEAFKIYPERGMIVHANHFVSPVALTKLKDTGIDNTPDSLYRDVRVRQALEPDIGDLTRDHLKAAFFDKFADPWSVCRPPRKNLTNNLSATVAMIIMEPGRGFMEVAPLPALNRNFTTYQLEMNGAAIRSVA